MRIASEIDCCKWFGPLPDGWEMIPTNSLFNISKGATVTKTDLVEDGVPVVNYGQVHSKANTGVKFDDELIRYVPEGFLPKALKRAGKGSFLFASTSEDLAGCGACVFNNTDQVVWPGGDTSLLTPIKSVENTYFAYLFLTDAWRWQIRRDLVDVKVFHVNKGNLKETYVVVPSLPEQKQIIAFLDKRCEAIDADIAQRKELNEKLNEYKKSLIFQAVTKGLIANESMKESDVPWLGCIPSRWKTVKVSSLFEIVKRIANKEDLLVLSITQKGIVPKNLNNGEGQQAASYENYQLVYQGDFAMNHMDLITGWVDISKFDGVTSPDYRVFRLKNESNAEPIYFLYLFQSCYMHRTFFGLGNGVADKGRWRLQTPAFRNFQVPLPPIEDQQAIVNFLDKKCDAIDKIVSRQNQIIEKLTEYKKSLIHHAVTGKIDYRKA